MYTIGSDPEFFVVKKKYEKYPAFKIISGTKEQPLLLGNGYSVLYDNVLIEGNIPPADSAEEFITNMRTLKVKMNKILRVFDCEILESSVELFDAQYLEDLRAQEFGCMPYVDAWTFEELGASKIEENWRPAGFHIHVGYENTSTYPKEAVNIAIARAFDFFVTLPARLYNCDIRRENSYGGYGKFIHKPYGLELRSLSGHFAKDDLLKWVYVQTIKSIDFVLKNDLVEDLLNVSIEDLTLHGAKNRLGISVSENRVRKEIVLAEPQKLLT